MDRPSTGHRRHEAGSITVVDLLRRQEGPVRIPSAHEAATVGMLDDLLGEAEPGAERWAAEHPRGWLARGAKLAGLALGSLALCGAVYAASTLTHHRPQAAPADQHTNLNDTVLTGVAALRPDTVDQQLSGSAHGSATPAPTRQAVRGSIATGHATGTVVGAAPPATTAPTTPSAAAPTAGSAPASAAAVVRDFYRLAATNPSLAYGLISPALLGGDASGFDSAWQSLSQVQVESVRPMSPGSVQAVVRMREPDGTWLRVVELLHVTGGHTPLISGAELLSAQHG